MSSPPKNLVELIRFFRNGKWTIGVLLFNGHAQSFTLEDAFRTEKIRGQTRIPAGLYQLELKPIGTSRFDNRAWNAPPLKYFGMIRLKDVNGFEEILIHPGNSDEDTEGCILVGLGANLLSGQVLGSSAAYLKIYPLIAAALKKGEPVSISIEDRDRPAVTDLIA